MMCGWRQRNYAESENSVSGIVAKRGGSWRSPTAIAMSTGKLGLVIAFTLGLLGVLAGPASRSTGGLRICLQRPVRRWGTIVLVAVVVVTCFVIAATVAFAIEKSLGRPDPVTEPHRQQPPARTSSRP